MQRFARRAGLFALALGVLLAGTAFAVESPAADRVAPATGAASVRALAPSGDAPQGAKVQLLRLPQTVGDAPTAVLWDNGPLVTHPGGGFGGADASRLQNSSLLMTILGFGHQIVNSNHVADDFTIADAAGWQIDTITFYAYQTGSTTTSTINDVRVQIWNGPPNAGGVVIWGDMTTNRLLTTGFSNTYRDTETTVGVNNRPIMFVTATIGTVLPAGTYWVEWTEGGTLASGPWAPPITIIGQTTTGNGLQSIAGTWNALMDVGPQGLPFVIEGTVNASISLDKTVGIVPAVCATTDSVTVATGTPVYYCYVVTNTGGTTFEFHTLEDSDLGTLFVNTPYTLAPGASAQVIVGATATAPVTNTGTWTAATNLPGYTVDDTIPYNWEDISGTGTNVPLSDDSMSPPIPLGFTFDYFGVPYTDTYISSNGFLTMLAGQYNGCCTGMAFPTAGDPDAVIGGWWEDLNLSAGGTVHYQTLGSAPNRRLVIQFTNVPHYPSGNLVTMEFKLFEGTNAIEVHYQAAPSDGGTHSAGVENETGTVGNQYYLGPGSLTTPIAVRYAIASPPITASASDTATVVIADPDIDITPASLSSTQVPNTQVTEPMDIHNLGTGDLNWTIAEAPPAPVAFLPASDGNFPRGKGADSAGPAPASAGAWSPQSALGELPLGPDDAYSWNGNGQYYTVFNINAPDVLPNIAPFPTGDFIGAGEYVNGLVYMVDTLNVMWEVNPATGAILRTFSATPPPGAQTYTGMAFDPTSGVVYATSCDITATTLFTLDVITGTATTIGPVTGAPCIIGIAVDGTGTLYGYDLVNDVLMSIDKATGAGTVIGPIGFNANYGQGMGWHAATDTLYMAAFNGGTFQPELRIVDRVTGNTSFVAVLGSTVPGGTNQLSWLGFELGPCSSPQDLPWVSASPTAGTTAPGGTTTVDVTFDSAGLSTGTYDGILCVASNDPDERLVPVPVTLTVTGDTMPFLDGFESGNTSAWSLTLP